MNCPYAVTPAADCDLDEHFLCLAERSRDVAARFLSAVDATLNRLASMSELGQQQEFRRPELAGLRAWQVRGFENYVVFYRPTEQGIVVMRVVHAARDLAAFFERPT